MSARLVIVDSILNVLPLPRSNHRLLGVRIVRAVWIRITDRLDRREAGDGGSERDDAKRPQFEGHAILLTAHADESAGGAETAAREQDVRQAVERLIAPETGIIRGRRGCALSADEKYDGGRNRLGLCFTARAEFSAAAQRDFHLVYSPDIAIIPAPRRDRLISNVLARVVADAVNGGSMPGKKRQKKAGQDKGKKNQARRRGGRAQAKPQQPSAPVLESARQD
jgi:hypothetical protein